MLEHEGSLLIHVTLETDGVLRRRRAQLLGQKAAMLIVAIRALNQFLVYSVVKRLIEVGPRLKVTRVAQTRLALHE